MRHVIEVQVIRRTDDGQLSSSYRTHVITLSNQDAVDYLVEQIKEGKRGWEKGLTKDDVLEYDDAIDRSFLRKRH